VEISQLGTFVAVADTGTFTEAGRVRHIGQSAVSASIATLEREVGARLFERTRTAAILTAAGQALLPHARAMLEEQRVAMAAVAGAGGRVAGHVHLGTLATSGRLDLGPVLIGLRRDHPEVRVSLLQSMTGSQGHLDLVRANRLDLALVAANGRPARGVDTETLLTERMLALVPATDRLARAPHLEIAQVSDRPYLALPPGWSARAVVDDVWHPDSTPIVQAADYGLLADLVAAGLGVAVVPEFAVPHRPDVVGVPTPLVWELMLVSSTRPKPAATDVVAQAIRGAARALGGGG
jgi:DNA-binding transcriptional LysR family regulator